MADEMPTWAILALVAIALFAVLFVLQVVPS